MASYANHSGVEQALRQACSAAGLDAAGARLLHHYSNAIYVLPAEPAVARITVDHDAHGRVNRTQAVTRWLIEEHRFPATQPLPGSTPIAVDADTVVSFWTYYHTPDGTGPFTSAHLAPLLRQLHRIKAPPLDLDAWVPLESLENTVRDVKLSASLTADERHWAQVRITEVRQAIAELDWPLGTGLIHGDAWVGNLLPGGIAGAAAVLGDWDWVGVGPREVDLVPTWHAAARYGKGLGWTRQFVAGYGYDLRDWNGYDVLMSMRDLVQLTGPIRRANDAPRYQRALRERLESLRSRNEHEVWTAL